MRSAVRRGSAAALLLVLVLVGCASSTHRASSSGPRTVNPPVETITCSAGQPLKDEGAFALGISPAGRICWEAAVSPPPGGSAYPAKPVPDGNSVVLDSNGDVYAVDLQSGRQRWRWSSGDAPAIAGFGGGNVVLGAADGRVLATKGPFGNDTVVGLEDTTGAVAWTQPVPSSHSGPESGPGGTLLFTTDAGGVSRAVSDATGKTLWSHPTPAPTPSGGGLVEVYAPATVAGPAIIELGATGVQAVNGATGATLWSRPGSINDVDFLDGDLLLTPRPGEGAGQYDVPTTAVDPMTGRPRWSTPALDPGGSEFFAAGGLLVHSQAEQGSHTLERLDPATGQVLWQAATYAYRVVGGPAGPIDLESTAYQSGTPSIVSRDPATGAVRWRTPLTYASGLDDAVDDDLYAAGQGAGAVVIDQHGTELTGVDATTGALRWRLSLPAYGELSAVTTGDGLVVQFIDEQYVEQGH